jgi:hypothetical protein
VATSGEGSERSAGDASGEVRSHLAEVVQRQRRRIQTPDDVGSTPTLGTVRLYSLASRSPMGLDSFLVKRGMVHLNT